jgi:hypothetical protein
LGPVNQSPYVEFDLAGTGLASTDYIMITDDPGTLAPGLAQAIDVDAVLSLHDPVATETTTWGAIKARYR